MYEAYGVRVLEGASLQINIVNYNSDISSVSEVTSQFSWILFYYEKPRCVEFTPYITALFRAGVYAFVHWFLFHSRTTFDYKHRNGLLGFPTWNQLFYLFKSIFIQEQLV